MAKRINTSFRPWQRIAFEHLWGHPYCLLVAPPGQGKSLLGQAQAMVWMEQGRKVLIATPRKLILQSFQGVSALRWNSDRGVTEGRDATEHRFQYRDPMSPEDDTLRVAAYEHLSTWLAQPRDSRYPCFITTHQGFLGATKKLIKQYGDFSCDDLAVVLDEAHLLSVDQRNRMGTILHTLMELGVPVMLMTATPYRSDDSPIVEPELVQRFRVYSRPFHAAIDEARHISGFETKLVVGNTLASLRRVLEAVERENRYIVLKLPFANKRDARRLAHELGFTPEEVRCRKAEDPHFLKKEFDRRIQRMCRELKLSHLSVAVDDENDAKWSAILEKARAGDPTELPRVVVAQEKVSMGVDCEWWTDSIMLGSSASPVLTVQFGTRSLRDHRSKDQRPVRYWTLVPAYWEPGVPTESAQNFAKRMIFHQLIWLFLDGYAARSKAPRLKDDLPPGPPPQGLAEPLGSEADYAAIARSPGLQAQNAMDRILNRRGTEDDRRILDALRHNPIEVEGADGSKQRWPSDDGNRPDDGNRLPKVSLSLSEELFETLTYGIDELSKMILRGRAKEFTSQLKASQAPDHIRWLYQRGLDLGSIAVEVGWHRAAVERFLEDAGLMKNRIAARKRARGGVAV